jgi:hypothetical protein
MRRAPAVINEELCGSHEGEKRLDPSATDLETPPTRSGRAQRQAFSGQRRGGAARASVDVETAEQFFFFGITGEQIFG